MSGVSRFTFLKSAAAMGAAASGAGFFAKIGRGGGGQGPPKAPDFYGIVTASEDGRLSVRRPHTPLGTRPTWSVEPAPNASVWRLRDASVGDFQPGEEVIAFGSWSAPSTFLASEISAMLYAVTGRVNAHGIPVAAGGTVDLGHVAPTGRRQLRPGDSFSASVIRNVDTGVMAAFEIADSPALATA